MNFLKNKLFSSWILLFCLALRQTIIAAHVDLEANPSSFILETRKIEIPQFPNAFNPSIIHWNNGYLMSFRIKNSLDGSTRIGLIQLDENFNPASIPQVVEVSVDYSLPPPRTQDPRLFTIGNDLFMVFNDMVNIAPKGIRRMFAARLEFDGVQFLVRHPDILLHYEMEITNRDEKNWVPFDYNGKLLLAYSISPHHILKPIFGKKKCETIAATKGKIAWNWGILRGGTPALKVGNEYLSFFHSAKDLTTLQSNGSHMVHYFMGAYTFNQHPPFNLTKISKSPIIGKQFYSGPAHNTWKPLRVIFPGGFVVDENCIWIAYGRQDHEIWIVKLDKKGLLDSLIPVTTIE